MWKVHYLVEGEPVWCNFPASGGFETPDKAIEAFWAWVAAKGLSIQDWKVYWGINESIR